ncbi:hypothetical protein [uncultured Thermomonospora sp.]|uniref:hypothetical protein n=1 Tax=uncultured Thermomonospora sp. TaxID=671175 RepID=UPI00259BEA4A|nr:hypothetical protein [uncultured Thermomonospora sp.]
MSDERIIEVIAESLFGGPARFHDATPTVKRRLMRAAAILFHLRAAGFDVYRPDECAAVGIGRWVEYEGRAVARTMTPPPPEIEPGTYRLVPVREDDDA